MNERLSQFKKLGPKPFFGTTDPTRAYEWIRHSEKTLEVIEATDAEKVKFVTFMLEGNADHWWSMKQQSLGDIVDWKGFKCAFFEQYYPYSLQEKKAQEFANLAQNDMSVLEYERRFTELSQFAPHDVSNEAQKVSKFVRGLRPDIKGRVRTFQCSSYASAVDKSVLAECDVDEIR